MKNSFLKLLSSILILSLLIAVVPFGTITANADENDHFYYQKDDYNEITITGHSNPIGDLVIPEEIDGCPVVSIGWDAFSNKSNLTGITIPDSVKYINSYAFEGCSSLESITIPDSITSIEYSLFKNCTSLKNITLPDSIKSISSYAFEGCSSLESITIPDSITSIENSVFKNCTSLKSISLPDSIKSINSYAFENCTQLTDINLPESFESIDPTAIKDTPFYNSLTADEYNIVYINKTAFELKGECPSEVSIKDGTISLNKGLFAGFSSLNNIILPDSISSIGYNAFYGCTGLKDIKLPENVTKVGSSAFDSCTNLKSITFGKNIKSFPYHLFYECESLEKVNYTGTISDWCNIDFYDDSANPLYFANNLYINNELITDLVIPDDIETIGRGQFKYCTSIKSVSVGNSVTKLVYGAFQGCSNIKSVSLPKSLKTIDDNIFMGCSSLESITIPENVEEIGNRVFTGCSNLSEMKVSPGNPVFHSSNNCIIETATKTIVSACSKSTIPDDGSVTVIGFNAFDNCGLKSITIPNTIETIRSFGFAYNDFTEISIPKSVKHIGMMAFYIDKGHDSNYSLDNIYYLGTLEDFLKGDLFELFYYSENVYINNQIITDIVIPNSITEINSSFSNCKTLKSVTFHNNVKTINSYAFSGCDNLEKVSLGTGIIDIGDSAFEGCKSLKEISIPDSVTSIFRRAFKDCTGLTSITIPDSVKTINPYAFSNCEGLEKITLGKQISDIDYNTFEGCKSLKEISIPDSVTSIGFEAFSGCTGLTSITIPDSVKTINWYAFSSCESLEKITLGKGLTDFNNAFKNCNNIKIVYYNGTSEEYDTISSYGNSFNSDDIIFMKGKNGEISFEFNPNTNSLSILGNGEITDYEFESTFADYADHTEKIIIKSGISKIGKNAFNGFSKVTKVVLPNTVETIDESLFTETNKNTSFICNKDSKAEEIVKENNSDILNYANPDLDGNNRITDNDAKHLLFNMFFPDEYCVEGYPDFNGDGESDIKDAVYILYHVYFPTLYPIVQQ